MRGPVWLSRYATTLSRTRRTAAHVTACVLCALAAATPGCGGAESPARLAFSIALPPGVGVPAPLATTNAPPAVYDLSTEGMIGRIRVEAPDMTTVERLFPTASDVGPEDDSFIVFDIEVPAGEARQISGIFYLNEGKRVTTFASQAPVQLSLEPGETVAVVLPLQETDTVPLAVTLDPSLAWAVRAYPVDGELDVLFPPVDIPDGDAMFTCEDLPAAHAFWFRLEDASGATADTVDLPWCTAGAGVCSLGEG